MLPDLVWEKLPLQATHCGKCYRRGNLAKLDLQLKRKLFVEWGQVEAIKISSRAERCRGSLTNKYFKLIITERNPAGVCKCAAAAAIVCQCWARSSQLVLSSLSSSSSGAVSSDWHIQWKWITQDYCPHQPTHPLSPAPSLSHCWVADVFVVFKKWSPKSWKSSHM